MRSPLTALVVAVVVGVGGCRNQSSTLSNPFTTADRVPPPSTRVLAPGTAQPSYPGEPLPGNAISAPPAGGVAPGTGFPPASTLPQSNASPLTPMAPPTTTPLVTPPGGWGASATPAQLSPGEVVQTQVDSMPLRFQPSANTQAFAAPADPQAMAMTYAAPASAAPAFPTQADAPVALAAAAPQQLQIREVTPAEYLSPPIAATPGSTPTRDGFRPQSGEPRQEDSSAQSFRPPGINKPSMAQAAGAADQFAVSENFQSLRGQLEYWPDAGMWTVRYLAVGSPVDSIGGRVIVDNPHVLANLQPGELVAVSGQLYARDEGDGTAKPAYRVATVQRQRQ